MAENLPTQDVDSEPLKQSIELKFPASAASVHAVGLALEHRLGRAKDEPIYREFQIADGSTLYLRQENRDPNYPVVIGMERRFVVDSSSRVEHDSSGGQRYLYFGESEYDQAELVKAGQDVDGQFHESPPVSEGEARQLLNIISSMDELASDD